MDPLWLIAGVAVPLFVLAYFADRQTWSKKPREELLAMIHGEDWKGWENGLLELGRRGEDLHPHLPSLLPRLLSETQIARTAARFALVKMYPELARELADFPAGASPEVLRARYAPLFARYGAAR